MSSEDLLNLDDVNGEEVEEVEGESEEESSSVSQLDPQVLMQEIASLRSEIQGLKSKPADTDDLMSEEELRRRSEGVAPKVEDDTDLQSMTIQQYDAYQKKRTQESIKPLEKKMDDLQKLIQQFAGHVNLKLAAVQNPNIKKSLESKENFERFAQVSQTFPNASPEQVQAIIDGQEALEREKKAIVAAEKQKKQERLFTEPDGLPREIMESDDLTDEKIHDIATKRSGLNRLFKE